MDVVAVTDSGSLDLRWAARCSSQNTQLPVIVSSSSLTWLGSDSGEVFRADGTGTGCALRLSHVGRWTMDDGTLGCSIGCASASSTHYLTIAIVFRRPPARPLGLARATRRLTHRHRSTTTHSTSGDRAVAPRRFAPHWHRLTVTVASSDKGSCWPERRGRARVSAGPQISARRGAGVGAAGNLPDLEKSRRTSRETLNEKPKQGIKKIRSAQVRAPLLNLPCLCQWLSLSLESSSVGNTVFNSRDIHTSSYPVLPPRHCVASYWPLRVYHSASFVGMPAQDSSNEDQTDGGGHELIFHRIHVAK